MAFDLQTVRDGRFQVVDDAVFSMIQMRPMTSTMMAYSRPSRLRSGEGVVALGLLMELRGSQEKLTDCVAGACASTSTPDQRMAVSAMYMLCGSPSR